jgi:Fur family ferric uptake transcriptional regulator
MNRETANPFLPCGKKRPERSPLKESEAAQIRERLRTYLIDHKLKFTRQRWDIVDCIFEGHGHWDAAQITQRVQRKFPKMGPATVYRTLKLLTEAKILEVVQLPGSTGIIKFELRSPNHHDHLMCLDCGEIFEFENEVIEKEQKDIAENLGFKEQEHRHMILGKCQLL